MRRREVVAHQRTSRSRPGRTGTAVGQRAENRGIDEHCAAWWNAPTRFLPWQVHTRLPPIALSTIASSVVGTPAQRPLR
jgi:hypothetical protein